MFTQHQDTRQEDVPDGGRHDRDFVAASKISGTGTIGRKVFTERDNRVGYSNSHRSTFAGTNGSPGAMRSNA
jgi:hypothetical protein